MPKIIIICGHYGVGKTNLAVNLALRIKNCTVVDLDIVNPYFRLADSENLFEKNGIRIIKPIFANTNVDIPQVPPEIYSIFNSSRNAGNNILCGEEPTAIIDVGGDDSGSTVLGMFAGKIKQTGYQMIYVINKHRPRIAEISDAVQMARDIEKSSGLNITGIFDNSFLGESRKYAETISEELQTPLISYEVNDYIKKFY